MEAIVLAGGFGTRLRTVVANIPKPMAPVAGRPFLEYVLRPLAVAGVRRAVLSVGYLAEQVIAHFGRAWGGLEIVYEVENTPLGTGGAVAVALRQCHEDPVLVLNGDTYLALEVPALLSRWQRSRHPVIVARRVPDAGRYGALQVIDGRVTRFAEKGSSGEGLINAGAYLLPRDLFGHAPPQPPFSLETDFLAGYVANHPVEAFISEGEFIDIGIPEDFARAQVMAASWGAMS